MDQSYWSVSSILADSSKIPCHFKLTVPGLSHLRGDAGSASQEVNSSQSQQHAALDDVITSGTKLELPYWLASNFVVNDLVDVSIPKPYSQRVRNALDADAKSVLLRGQSNWWFAVGARLGELMSSEMLMNVLTTTYTTRLPAIHSSAQHLASGAGSGSGDRGGSSSGRSGSGTGGGFGTSVGMSAEMVEFVNGLEETEKAVLKASQDSATAVRHYLAGRK